MEKLNEALIERGYVCTIIDIFTMKGITDHRIVKMSGEDGQELEPFEPMAGRRLGRQDAVVISQFTEAEIDELIEGSYTDEGLGAFQSRQTEEGIRHYNIHYASDDPICAETIDYMLPDNVDTSSSFSGDYQKIIQDAVLDNVASIAKWLCESKGPFLGFRVIENDYIGSGMIRDDIMIREMKTKDVVVILERKDPDGPGSDSDFMILTAYPDITERALTAVPTGRDIRADIHETNTYKQADGAEKRLLDQKVLRGLTH